MRITFFSLLLLASALGAGTAAVVSTSGREVHLGKGAPLAIRLAAPVTIRVRG